MLITIIKKNGDPVTICTTSKLTRTLDQALPDKISDLTTILVDFSQVYFASTFTGWNLDFATCTANLLPPVPITTTSPPSSIPPTPTTSTIINAPTTAIFNLNNLPSNVLQHYLNYQDITKTLSIDALTPLLILLLVFQPINVTLIHSLLENVSLF
jgi:hypothetical protein